MGLSSDDVYVVFGLNSERQVYVWLDADLTAALTKLENDWWIELENTYKTRIAQRKELYAIHGKRVLDYRPGSELACKELMEIVLQYICARYPQYFTLVDNRVFRNGILGTEQDVTSKHPLEILMDNVPEDFAITMRDDVTGYYVLRAAVICSSLGWDVSAKIGLPLDDIHKPVPDYKEKMQFSMNRYVYPFLLSTLTSHTATRTPLTTCTASSPKCQPTSLSNAAPGVSKSDNPYSCQAATPTKPTVYPKAPTSTYQTAIYG